MDNKTRRKDNGILRPLAAAVIMACSGLALADSPAEPNRDSGKPNPLKNVYFGEQHLHTTNSPDAFVIGTRGSWEDAYNWAQGKEILLSTTQEKIQKSTPYAIGSIAAFWTIERVVAITT